MTAGRLVHKSTDQLPEQAWEVMIAGFRARKTYPSIALELAQLGFHVPERTIARRAVEWRAEQLRREALKVMGTQVPRVNLLEQVIGLIEMADTRPGWQVRGKRRVHKAVLSFLDAPSLGNAQSVNTELTRFQIEALTWQGRGPQVSDLAGEAGELGERCTTAGEAGFGGHNNEEDPK